MKLTHKDLIVALDALKGAIGHEFTISPFVFSDAERDIVVEKLEDYLESFNVGERDVDEPVICERCQKQIATRHICQDCITEYARAATEKRLGDS